MSEELIIEGESKADKYNSLYRQLQALIGDEKDLIANLANITAALKSTFNFFWVGFYWVKEDELVLGPFQGSIACTRISFGKGVCGAAWQQNKTIIVDDVDEFPGHIACSSLSKSEIVIPILKNNEVIGVLDVDSDELCDFDDVDKIYLQQISSWITTFA